MKNELIHVDRKKYEAGKRECFGKKLAPGMNHCSHGDRVQTIEGKRAGTLDYVQYSAPLQAVIDWDDGGTSTIKLYLLERKEP